MTLDELRHAVTAKEIDTVILAMTDMQGRLQGKRFTARHFLDAVLGHGAEGCNYLLAVDVDMNTVDGYAMSSWEQGYGDFVMRPRPRRRCGRTPWLPGTALAARRPGVARPHAGRRLAAADPARARSTASAARGWTRARGHRARVHALQHLLPRRPPAGLPRPRAGELPQRRLLDPRHLAGRAADPPDPQRDARGRARRRELQGRVQLRPARDQLPLRRGARDRRQARRLQERREGDRRPGGHGDLVHGEVRPARGQLVPRPPVAARRRRRPGVRRRARGLRRVHGRACSPRCPS